MARIRVAIVTMAPLLSGLIGAALTGPATIEVVADFATRGEAKERLTAVAPDVVLVGLRPGESGQICRTLLRLVPDAKVIGVSTDARAAHLHRMCPCVVELPDLSRRSLLAAMRGGSGPARRRERPAGRVSAAG